MRREIINTSEKERRKERERVYWKSKKINKKKIVEKILSLSGLGAPLAVRWCWLRREAIHSLTAVDVFGKIVENLFVSRHFAEESFHLSSH